MARADKQAAVAEIVESFNDAAGAVLTDYRGLTVKELQDLRRSLGENADYAVVKNTLAKLAASEAGMAGFDELLVGPTAIAFLKGDVVEAAKGLRDFAKANPALIIKGGYLDGKAIDAKEVAKLADLESRDVLLGKLAGAMLASLQNAVFLLNAPLAQAARVVGALQAKAEQDPSILAGGASARKLRNQHCCVGARRGGGAGGRSRGCRGDPRRGEPPRPRPAPRCRAPTPTRLPPRRRPRLPRSRPSRATRPRRRPPLPSQPSRATRPPKPDPRADHHH